MSFEAARAIAEGIQNPLPKIAPTPGAVCAQYVRCGRAGCRCNTGRRHLAYYRFWREGGRLRKAYVKRDKLGETVAACTRWRQERERERALRRKGWEEWRALRNAVRGLEGRR
jgi:hypothetical protein